MCSAKSVPAASAAPSAHTRVQCDGVSGARKAIQGVLARKGPAGFVAGMGPRVLQVGGCAAPGRGLLGGWVCSTWQRPLRWVGVRRLAEARNVGGCAAPGRGQLGGQVCGAWQRPVRWAGVRRLAEAR